MKFKTLILAITLVFSGIITSFGQSTFTFGSSNLDTSSFDTPEFLHSFTSSTLQISGESGSGSFMANLLSPASFDSLSNITLTASITSGNPDSTFSLWLVDSSNDYYQYSGLTSSFGTNSSTVLLTLDSEVPLVNLFDIVAVAFSFDGHTEPNFSMILESVGTAAIPEPSVPLLVGLSAAGLLLFRRARRAPALAA